MNYSALQKAAKLNKERKRRKRRYRVVSMLAAIVVFCTTYALILPAITMEPDYFCGYTEHTHNEDCYREETVQALTCLPERHIHSSDCFDSEGMPVCGYQDFILHIHNSFCYGKDNELICSIPETDSHIHTDICYETATVIKEETAADTKENAENETEDAAETEKASEKATETEKASEKTPSEPDGTEGKGDAEKTAQTGAETEETKAPAEKEEETEAVTEKVTEKAAEKVTEKEEDTQKKTAVTEKTVTYEKVLVCQKQGSTAHKHNPSCKDAEGNFICGMLETYSHTHTEDCLGEVTEKKLICTLTEHIHDDTVCTSDPNADVETKQIWESTLPATKTGKLGADLMNTAKSQIGYKESETNKKADATGKLSGYTRYGDWAKATHGPWNAHFISFCMHYTNNASFKELYETSPEAMRKLWLKKGFYEGAGDHEAGIGDLIFLDMNTDAAADYVAVISGFSGTAPTVIAGDWEDAVTETVIDDTSIILGYGLTCKIPVLEEEEQTEEETSEENSTEEQTKPSMEGYAGEDAGNTENFDKLEEEGFYTYWQQFMNEDKAEEESEEIKYTPLYIPSMKSSNAIDLYSEASDSQIVSYGGSNVSDDGKVTVSKTIKGTELENVFDITLTVDTTENLEIFKIDPDMAIVIVMDISNTMRTNYGDVSRYAAAVESAENFIDKFEENAPENTNAYLGFVAFNTSGHEIFDLQECTTPEHATALKNEMRTDTGAIINASGYANSGTRFTNIEAGLAMGYDMLNSVDSNNKYIIFLSDGFPTTYMKTNTTTYEGYDPNCTSGTPGKDGVFYDSVYGTYCLYGTSYSDKAAIRAREKAEEIKDLGANIFSIGVDVGGQSLQEYLDRGNGQNFSVVDRTGTTYDIGDPTSENSFPNWLRDSIGSGYYYDSNNSEELEEAFQQIFDEIKSLQVENTTSIWAAVDPLPLHTDDNRYIEFIHFYDKDGNPQESLSGTYEEAGENTAYFDASDGQTIHWDLKESGYSSTKEGNTTYYSHSVSYRVRLENEEAGFEERLTYMTNDVTELTYQSVTTTNGKPVYSEMKTVEFPLPSVLGYETEFGFNKIDHNRQAMKDVEFVLSHDTEKCNICHGDGTYTSTVGPYKAYSDNDGNVSFSHIPSGHIYKLEETVPENYRSDNNKYTVTVSYDELNITLTRPDGTTEDVTNSDITITNYPGYLPETESLLVAKELISDDGSKLNPLVTSALSFSFRVVACDEDSEPTEELFLLPGTLFTVVENGKEIGTDTIGADGIFTIKAGQIAVFADLLEKGSHGKYAVQELIPTELSGNYKTVSYLLDGAVYTLTGESTDVYTAYTAMTFPRDGTTSIIFRNTVNEPELCELTVTKTLGSDGFSANEEFTIQVSLANTLMPIGTEYTVGGEVRTVTEEGIIKLKANETAVFTGLLKGTKYTVRELISESTAAAGSTVNAALNKSVEVASHSDADSAYRITDGVKNNYNYYWEGGKSPSYFTVNLGAKYNISRVKIYNYWKDSRAYKYQIYTSLDNKNFTLATETAYITATSSGKNIYFDEEMPAKYIKVVMPEGNSVNNYCHCVEFEAYGYIPDDSATGATYQGTVGQGGTAVADGNGISGTLPSGNADITVTNTKYPFSVSFPIKKTAVHNTESTTFDFKVEQVANGTWSHIADVNGTAITVTDGTEATKNVTITFPANSQGKYYYKISEIKGDASFFYDESFYIVEVTADSSFAYVSAVYKNGTEEVSEEEIAFTNVRKSQLYVSKIVDANEKTGVFNFTATVTLNGEAVELAQPPEGASYTVNGNVISFSLQDGEFVHIDSLPYGCAVTVTETLTGKEYSPFYKIEGTHDISVSGSSCLINFDESVKNVKFINKAYYEIPATGGFGTIPFTVAGILMITTAFTTAIIKRRKEAQKV